MESSRNGGVERWNGVMPGIAFFFPRPAASFPVLQHPATPLLQNNYMGFFGFRE